MSRAHSYFAGQKQATVAGVNGENDYDALTAAEQTHNGVC